MGIQCSQVGCTCTTCNCFIHDNNIKNIEVKRSAKVKWMWTNEHESILVQILTAPEYNYNAPIVIIDVIKNLTYCKNESFYVRETHLCQETYYSKQNKLLNKKLCPRWYHSKLLNRTSFPVIIFSSDPNTSDCVMHSINNDMDHILPVLQMWQNSSSSTSSSKSSGICSIHTLYINHCQIEINVMQIDNINDADNNYYVYCNQPTYFIVINENDSIQSINKICTSIWNKNNSMNNCIFVRNITMNESENISLLATELNVPYIEIDYNQQNSIHNLFTFAIKHYWFCQATKWNSIVIS